MIDTNPFIGYYDTIQIKKGGMAFVYISKLRDNELSIRGIFEEKVAIKTLKPELANHNIISELFYKECLIWLVAGNHSNVVKALSAHQTHPNPPFILLELADYNLREYLSNYNVGIEGKLKLLFEICQGLIHLRNELEDFVHLDLKPDNILICNNIAKISDFGISKVKMKSENIKLTEAGALGSPLYMSPEQINRERLTVKSDIYSFGCIMFEVLSEYPVFHPLDIKSKEEIYNFHINIVPRSIRSIDKNIFKELDEITAKCLNKNPELRFDSFDELSVLIKNISKHYFSSNFSEGIKREMTSSEFYNFCQGFFNLQYFEDTINNIESNSHLIAPESKSSFEILKARALLNYGRKEDSLKVLSNIIEHELPKGDLLGYYFAYLKFHYNNKDFHNAIQYAQKAISVDQNSGEAWTMLSFSLWNTSQRWEAIEAMFSATKVSRKISSYIYLIDQIWLFNQNMEFIMKVYYEAIGYHPTSYKPLLKIASILIEVFEQDKESSFESKVIGIDTINNFIIAASNLNAPAEIIENFNAKINSLK